MKKKLDNLGEIQFQEQIKKPNFFKLILLNDDFTTMDFVVKILIIFLNKTNHEANILMLKIHNTGSAVCGVFPKDVAITIQNKIHNYSRVNKQPLKCIIKE
jgi:ATP-dependent Clp protease adaptor protein ClpS